MKAYKLKWLIYAVVIILIAVLSAFLQIVSVFSSTTGIVYSVILGGLLGMWMASQK